MQQREKWRIRYCQVLYQLHQSPDIIRIITAARLQWAGHLQRMGKSGVPRIIVGFKRKGNKRVERPKL
jgi:hypothetical protein